MKRKKEIKPTESELEILQLLWQKGPSSVRSIHELMSSTKDVGYTTTLKIMQIMVEKGIAKRDASARVHIYEAAIDQKATQKTLVNDFLNSAFSGSAKQLILQVLGNHKTSKEELEEIKALIKRMEQ